MPNCSTALASVSRSPPVYLPRRRSAMSPSITASFPAEREVAVVVGGSVISDMGNGNA